MKSEAERREKFISDNLAAFDPGLLQDLRTLIMHLRSIDVKEYEFLEYVQGTVLGRGKSARSRSVVDKERRTAPKCPECSSPLTLAPVNTSKCNQVGGDYKSHIKCTSIMSCDYEEFRNESTDEVYAEYLSRRKKSK